QKVWISRVQHSEWMILLARTTPLAEVQKKTDGMSIFLVDLRAAEKSGMTVRPIANMVNHETNELFFENLEIPAENLIEIERAPCGEGVTTCALPIYLRAAEKSGMTVRPIANMVNHETNELFFENLEIPAENLI